MDNPHGWWAASILPAAIAALAAVLVGLVNSVVSRSAAKLGFDAKMVEIGVSILAADPGKTDINPARQWAIDLVSDHSGRAFSAEDREKLLLNALRVSGAIEGGSGVSGRATLIPP